LLNNLVKITLTYFEQKIGFPWVNWFGLIKWLLDCCSDITPNYSDTNFGN
jgi:hypothetical protein